MQEDDLVFGEDMSLVLKSARITDLVFLIITAAATFYYLWASLHGKKETLRLLPAVAAISDGVDRGVEEGRPVFSSAGNLSLLSGGTYAPMAIASMNITRYTANLCVTKGARIIIPVPANPEMFPILDGIFREAAVSHGKPEAYRRQDVRYYGPTEWSFGVSCARDVALEKPALYIAVGANSGGDSLVQGTAYFVGSTIIAGSPRWNQQGGATVMSDYFLWCEDVYAAGAYTSGDDSATSTYVGGDVVKLCILGLFIVATILFFVGLPIVANKGWLFQ
jgi:hypothetical protein